MSKSTESMFDGKDVLIPLAEVSYILKFPSCIEVHFKGSAESVTLAQPDQNALISAWCRYRGEVEADTLMDLDGAQLAPIIPEGIQRVASDFYWDRATLHHVPFVRVEFQPVAADEPDDAKGWQDRDRFFAAMLEATREAKP